MKSKKVYVVGKIVLVGLAVLLLGAGIDFWGRNTFLLNEMMDCLIDTAHKIEGIEILDRHSGYGKLLGNGNGVEYCGAILVKALDENDVVKLVEELEDNYELVGYRIQKDLIVDEEYFGAVRYRVSESVIEEFSGCLYTVYFLNSQHKDSNLHDPKGH